MIASFDVFDTCLTRDVAVPTDVFYELGRRVLARLKLPVTDSAVEDFVAARCQAYEAVRTQGGAEDVLLPKIWECLCDRMGWTVVAALWELELAVEAEHLFAVEKTKTLVADLRRKGNRIVFTSDIYFPPEFVERLLAGHGFFQPGDGLYTSGAMGKMKRSGNLFRHLLAAEKVRPSQVTHHGDEAFSDGRVPRGMGIKTVMLSHGRLGRTEQALLREQGAGHSRVTRVAGGIRKFRAATTSGEGDEFTELVAGFVGPVTLGFAVWTLAQARGDGIQRLYFLSRDCQLAQKAAEILAVKQGGGVECRYLFHSRQALFLGLVAAIDEKELWWLRRDFEVPVLERLLAKLELEYDSVAVSFDRLAGGERGKFVLKSEADWKFFWTALKTPPLHDRLMQLIAQRREAALAYFEAEGLFEPMPWALVDLGWHLSCQEALQKLLKQRGRSEPVRGYYLGLKAGRLPESKAGPARGLFYEHSHDRQMLAGRQTIFSHIVPLEFVLGIADHLTVQRFEKNGAAGKPVFRGGQLNEAESCFARNLHEATLRFVRMNVELAEQFQDEAATRLMLGAVLDCFALHPDLELVEPLQKINAAADQNLLDARPLIAPLNWGDALRMALPGRLRGRFAKDQLWLEGSLVVSSPLIRGLAIFKRRLTRLANGQQA